MDAHILPRDHDAVPIRRSHLQELPGSAAGLDALTSNGDRT